MLSRLRFRDDMQGGFPYVGKADEILSVVDLRVIGNTVKLASALTSAWYFAELR
jgi:hypothetical protein